MVEPEDIALWRALQPLKSVAVWLMTGAHPDDEWSGFLAWLKFGRGVQTVYACATRGEGGQNALGPERGRILGALRSREMERAAAELDLAVQWLGAGPGHGEDDPIVDFGFSRSAEDTLRRWGETRLVERLVAVILAVRPDALSPTFLDVPGQHGHHRAVTRCSFRSAEIAAAAGWRVRLLYLPAFSGAGGSYDDREAPPPETVRVDLGAGCAALGAGWAELGERSRRCHATQGMGRDVPPGPLPFALHRCDGVGEAVPLEGVPHGVGDLAGLLAAGAAARALRAIDAAIAGAMAAFPDRSAVAAALHRGLAALDRLVLPAGAEDIGRRLALKRRQIGRAAAVALGIGATLAPGALRTGATAMAGLTVQGNARAKLRLPAGWRESADTFVVPFDGPAFGTLRDGFDPLGGNDPLGVALRWTHAGSDGALVADPVERIAVAPAVEVRVLPERVVRRLASATPVLVELEGAVAPASWPVSGRCGGRLLLDLPAGRLDLEPAGVRLARSGAVALVAPASAALLRAAIAIDPGARIGVVATETDATLDWLRQLDIDAVAIDDATLAAGDLGRWSTLLVGVFGFGQRPALRAHRGRLLTWIAAGGSLVTLYHRPGDGWDDGHTPPRPITLGSPSLRWRATDPAAPVTPLRPEHRLLSWPNAIGPGDWAGWVRERGLYFARDWDAAYVPLLEVADSGEAPFRGALLAADIGRGRHVHVALALHHQFTALVPGAFRLLANLVARPA